MRRHPRSNTAGFALIEVLIAILVFSIALLGIAYTQQTALRTSHAAFLHSLGVIAAADGVERLWANACTANPAATVQTAWRAHWSEGDFAIPGWDNASSIAATAGNPREFTVTVRWRDERLGDEAARSVVHTIQLPATSQLRGC